MVMAKHNMSVGHGPFVRHEFSNPAKRDRRQQKFLEKEYKSTIHYP